MSSIKSRFIRLGRMASGLLGLNGTGKDIFVLAETLVEVAEESEKAVDLTNSKLMAIITSDYHLGVSRLKDATSENSLSVEERIELIDHARNKFEKSYNRLKKLKNEAIFILPEAAVYVGICHIHYSYQGKFRLEMAERWLNKALGHLKTLETSYENFEEKASRKIKENTLNLGTKSVKTTAAVGGGIVGMVAGVVATGGLGLPMVLGIGGLANAGALLGGGLAFLGADAALSKPSEAGKRAIEKLTQEEIRVRCEAGAVWQEVNTLRKSLLDLIKIS